MIGGADKGKALCHSPLWEHLGSVTVCDDSWFSDSIVSGGPGFTDIKRKRWPVPHMLTLSKTFPMGFFSFKILFCHIWH